VADVIRIAVVDNYPLFRMGVVQTLRRAKSMIVVADGATSEYAIELAKSGTIDLLLIEMAVPGSVGAAQAILTGRQNVQVVFLAATEDDELATQALQAGAHGLIMKGITGPELVKAIKSVHAGERYITSDLAWRLVTQPVRSATQSAQGMPAYGTGLSIREQQVLDHASRGRTNQEIASLLGLGLSTIKHYKTLAFRKMGVRNRLEAIGAATSKRVPGES